MRSILYFVAGRSGMSAEHLPEVSLGYLGISGVVSRTVTRGPGDQAGVVFATYEPPKSTEELMPGYYPERQEWAAFPTGKQDACPTIWMGVEKGKHPGPEDLARREPFQGHEVVLGDGQSWMIPVVRALAGYSPLPRKLQWDGASWSPGDVMPAYQQLFEGACHIWDVLAKTTESTVTLTDECDMAVQALGLNYRLGPGEVSLLGLLNTRTEGEVVLAALDWPALEALKKKVEAGEPSLNAGDEA